MADPILSPMQPGRPQLHKTVNVKVDVRHHDIPRMLKHLSRFALGGIGVAATIVMFEYEIGSPADIAGTIAFFAWNLAAVEAIMQHITSQKADSRQEVIEEITRAKTTHLTIR